MKAMIRLIAAVSMVGATAGPTLADSCPTLSDLPAGIRILHSDGYQEVYTATGEHMVTAHAYFDPDDKYEALLAQGVYLVQTINIKDDQKVADTRRTYAYPLSPGDMPLPKPRGRWIAQIAVTASDGVSTENHVMRFLDETTLSFGACVYDMVPVKVIYGEGEGETLYYLPELGFAVVGIWTSGGKDDVMEFSDIEAVK